jgi:signal transduction histidine kinase
LVTQLAAKEERLVAFWAEVAEYIYSNQNDESFFLINNVLLHSPDRPPVVSVPAILTDSLAQAPLMHNLDFGGRYSPRDSARQVLREFEAMKSSPDFKPIRIELPTGGYQWVYYRETDELRQLRIFPVLTLGVLVVFLGFLIVNFVIAQRSQLNKVWVGLAKETAHQLGTPISGLIAWVELLKLQPETDPELAVELEKDVQKLKLIADRFSKIGSSPDLVPTNLVQILEEALAYARRRSPRGMHFSLHSELPPDFSPPLSPLLFGWVIENLLRNAVDAGATEIKLYAFMRGKQFVVDIEDNGSGMTRKVMRSVFKPGFTTKKRGWGLGLSLAQRIINSYHKGSISIRFSEPGKGTTFRVQLPAS